jgi:hypothetical protein
MVLMRSRIQTYRLISRENVGIPSLHGRSQPRSSRRPRARNDGLSESERKSILAAYPSTDVRNAEMPALVRTVRDCPPR